MAGLTRTQINALITKIDTELNNILDDPDANITYKIGDKTVNKSDKVEWLMKMLEKFNKMLTKIPSESIDSVEYKINEFGEDVSEYIGDVD